MVFPIKQHTLPSGCRGGPEFTNTLLPRWDKGNIMARIVTLQGIEAASPAAARAMADGFMYIGSIRLPQSLGDVSCWR